MTIKPLLQEATGTGSQEKIIYIKNKTKRKHNRKSLPMSAQKL